MSNKGKYKVEGYYRKTQNGERTYVHPHYRSYPGRGPNKPPQNAIELDDETGWSKELSPNYRRRLVYEATDGRKTQHNRYVEAGEKMQALANLNQDSETQRKAEADADHFYERAEETK